VKQVRESMGLDNLVVMVPFCRTVTEAQKVVAEMASNGLRQADGLKVCVIAVAVATVVFVVVFIAVVALVVFFDIVSPSFVAVVGVLVFVAVVECLVRPRPGWCWFVVVVVVVVVVAVVVGWWPPSPLWQRWRVSS
jgi:hypothetical protein